MALCSTAEPRLWDRTSPVTFHGGGDVASCAGVSCAGFRKRAHEAAERATGVPTPSGASPKVYCGRGPRGSARPVSCRGQQRRSRVASWRGGPHGPGAAGCPGVWPPRAGRLPAPPTPVLSSEAPPAPPACVRAAPGGRRRRALGLSLLSLVCAAPCRPSQRRRLRIRRAGLRAVPKSPSSVP